MNSNEIKKIAHTSGADIYGIASIERFAGAPSGFHPSDIYRDTKSVVVFARRFPKGAVCTGNPLQYSISENIVTDQIRHITYNFSLLLEDRGITAVPVYTEPYSFWDKDTQTGKGDLSLKHAGYLAGLGVFGRNHLLYNYKYGNLIKLGAVLINIAAEPDEIQTFTFCRDTCMLCLKNCPSEAITGVKKERHVIDPERCIKCGACISVCKFNAVEIT